MPTPTPTTNLPLPAKSAHHVLLNMADRNPDDPVIEFAGRRLSYRSAADQSVRFASALAAMGVEPGDRVGILLPNLPEYLPAYYGALIAGATTVLFNVMLTPREIEYQANDSGVKVMVVFDKLMPSLEAARPNLTDLAHIIFVGETPEGEKNFHALIENGSPDFAPHEPELSEIVQLIYTSGTTGAPKGAMISHFNLLAMMASLDSMRPHDKVHKTLCVLPLFHAFGLVGLLNMSILKGGSLYLQPRFEPEPVIDALKNKGITSFAGTPTMFFHILNHPASEGAEFPDLTRAGSGGAALPVEIRGRFRERFNVEITEGYGLSETTVSLCGYPDGMLIKSGSIGVPNPEVDMKIVDDDGNEVLVGDTGEIIARGPNIMVGYWNKPEETKKALRDGWLYTGDLGYIDHHGYFFIVDRKKDMIIKGGYNIYPREIEEVIYQLDEINMAAVVGVPDEAKGELVHAVVSLKPEAATTPEAIMKHLVENLAKYKLPAKVAIVDEIPTGATGKILKREIKANWDKYSGKGE